MFNHVAFYTILTFITFSLTLFICRYAKWFHLVAVADERSSHQGDIATGGGLAIAIVFLVVTWLGFKNNFISFDLFIALIGGGLILAIIGFWDDIKPLPIRFRIAAHTLAALWAIYWLGGLPSIVLGNWQLSFGHLSPVVTFLAVVWLVNLYNFMDGIDGLAGTQAITIALSATFIALLNHQLHQVWLYAALAAIVTGFLYWNWPRARIFMGDVGSGFLGYVFAILMLNSSQECIQSFWVFTILFSVFLVDASLTLFRRIVMGEPFYQPHCTHSYQILAQYWQSHRKVTVLVLCINLFWLWPLAYLANRYPDVAFQTTLVALVPVLMGCIYLQAKQEVLLTFVGKSD